MATSERHGVADRNRHAALDGAAERGLILLGEQRDAFDHLTGNIDLASVVGYAGSGKSAMLGVARDAWEREGYNVRGATRALATGRTGDAIHAYGDNGMVHSAETREDARVELVEGWDQARSSDPSKSIKRLAAVRLPSSQRALRPQIQHQQGTSHLIQFYPTTALRSRLRKAVLTPSRG